ncbi:MAG: hypothetical protein RBS73_12380 [Prolixibacteraceae bacterium]|nr:hypothetical protein [Prolixibacteraceae bacterium]
METSNNAEKKQSKKINDFVWVIIGIAGLIVALLLLKYFMHGMKLV